MDTVTLDRRDAPRVARRLVADECARALTGPGCAEAAALLTSEVVTNAVRHGSGDITLGLSAGTLLVLVEVGDDDVGTPRARELHHDDDEGGRGLQIVTALASGWGVRYRQPGKIVWFTVPAQP